jgi:hypothetical protein
LHEGHAPPIHKGNQRDPVGYRHAIGLVKQFGSGLVAAFLPCTFDQLVKRRIGKAAFICLAVGVKEKAQVILRIGIAG